MYYDTHAHFDSGSFNPDRHELLSSMPEMGITLINNIGCDLPSSQESIALAEQYPFVYAVVGHWPGNTDYMDEETLEAYRQMAKHEKVVAIGEIGLDYFHKNVSPETQKYWFRRQMELAYETGLPVVIHERDAHGDAMEIVREWADKVTGVFHCYSGSAEMAKELVKLGWYLSFTGVITFKNARRAIEAIAATPLDRIMIETDCPYLAPIPLRGKRNEPAYLTHTIAKIAEIRGISPENLADRLFENSLRALNVTETEVN